MSHVEKINTRKRNTINIVSKFRCLANLRKITFILFECHRFIAKSIDFYHERVHDNKEFNRRNSKPCCKSQIMTRLVEL